MCFYNDSIVVEMNIVYTFKYSTNFLIISSLIGSSHFYFVLQHVLSAFKNSMRFLLHAIYARFLRDFWLPHRKGTLAPLGLLLPLQIAWQLQQLLLYSPHLSMRFSAFNDPLYTPHLSMRFSEFNGPLYTPRLSMRFSAFNGLWAASWSDTA